MYGLKDANKMNKQNKNELIVTENRLVVTGMKGIWGTRGMGERSYLSSDGN